MGAEMRRIRSGWTVALILVGWLVPLAAAAVPMTNPPVTSSTHFILGYDPYRISDGNPVVPGSNAPLVPTQNLNLPDIYGNRFIRLDLGTDYSVDNGNNGDLQFFPMYNEEPTDPAFPMTGTFRVTWSGSIDGEPWMDALPEECESPSSAGCDLMRTSTGDDVINEEIKLFFVLWDIRWVAGSPDPINSPSVLGGFDISMINAMDPVNDPISGAMHADDTSSMFLPGTADLQGGMGIKMSADAGDPSSDPTTFTAEWFLSENPFDVHGRPGDRFWVGFDLFVYRVPEPGTSLLLVSGLIGLAAFGRPRRT
jgi:hypothetical protein